MHLSVMSYLSKVTILLLLVVGAVVDGRQCVVILVFYGFMLEFSLLGQVPYVKVD